MPDVQLHPVSTIGLSACPPPAFTCNCRTEADTAQVHVTGELDIATTPQLERALRNAGFTFENIRHGQMEAELLLRPLTWGTAKAAAA